MFTNHHKSTYLSPPCCWLFTLNPSRNLTSRSFGMPENTGRNISLISPLLYLFAFPTRPYWLAKCSTSRSSAISFHLPSPTEALCIGGFRISRRAGLMVSKLSREAGSLTNTSKKSPFGDCKMHIFLLFAYGIPFHLCMEVQQQMRTKRVVIDLYLILSVYGKLFIITIAGYIRQKSWYNTFVLLHSPVAQR